MYTNEAARSATESLEKGIVAVKHYSSVILVSKERVIQAVQNDK